MGHLRTLFSVMVCFVPTKLKMNSTEFFCHGLHNSCAMSRRLLSPEFLWSTLLTSCVQINEDSRFSSVFEACTVFSASLLEGSRAVRLRRKQSKTQKPSPIRKEKVEEVCNGFEWGFICTLLICVDKMFGCGSVWHIGPKSDSKVTHPRLSQSNSRLTQK